MGFFKDQFLSVIEWNETDDGQMFHKFEQDEIKKGSKLIIRPGQCAIFMNNGAIDGVFTQQGDYDIETQIIPVLSTLKGFKFGLNSGMRAEVLFVNTKEFNEKWGTKQPINLQTPALPGGMPIRAHGGYQFKLNDCNAFVEMIAGVKESYTTDDIQGRITSLLDQLLLTHISTEGKDMFNLQASAAAIAEGIRRDLDEQLSRIGIAVTGFQINSVSYPKEVQEMQNKMAGQAMIGDVNKYTQVAAADAMANGNTGTGQMAGAMMGMQMGTVMAQQLNAQMNSGATNGQQASGGIPSNSGTVPNFCPNCGTPTNGANFCGNCGTKLI